MPKRFDTEGTPFLFTPHSEGELPVFVCIGSDDALHVGIFTYKPFGELIAFFIVVGA